MGSFMPQRDTIKAIYIIRRLMDLNEQAGHRGSYVLLDWEKAFANVNHTKLMLALRRYRVPEKNQNDYIIL